MSSLISIELIPDIAGSDDVVFTNAVNGSVTSTCGHINSR